MNKLPTVRIEPTEDYPAILMTWEHQVSEADVVRAFNRITMLLETTEYQQYVIVDLGHNPVFPLRATINSALFGPYRNPKLIAWLVIGSSPLARTIEKTLASVGRRKNVEWFDSIEAVTDYLHELAYQSAS